MSADNSSRLRIQILVLMVVYVMTFAGGFLQDTPYNFVNHVFFFLLFMGGAVLMGATAKSRQRRTARVFLFLTGLSAALLFVFYAVYEWSRLASRDGLEASTEGLLYLLTLVFWICAIGSLASIRRPQEL